MTDQHSQHWPDKGHLHKWPSDATPDKDEAQEPNARLALPARMRKLLWLVLLYAALGMLLWQSGEYLRNRRKRMEQAFAIERANAVERRIKEQQRREYLTAPRPDIDKAMKEFSNPIGEQR